ncbi:MAG: T9SS type A sorting domain-containing protein [Bacteroidia bacterium]
MSIKSPNKGIYCFIIYLLLTISNGFSQGNTPCTATSISSNTNCVNTSGTTASLTYQSNAANAGAPSCASPGAPDGWYSFTPTSTGTYTISLTAGTITDSGMSIYTNSSGCSGTFTEVECDDDDGAGSMSQIIRSLTAGTQYFIRIWQYGGSGTGTFSICITSPPPPPSNDDPSGATSISVGATCSYTTFTNANATASSCGTIPAPGCSSYSGGDIWFSVTVPASGSITFDSQTGVMTDGGMAVYSGTPCGVLTLLGCDDDSSPNGSMPMLTISGQTPGATLYVRFWEFGNDNNGTFGLCATAAASVSVPGNDNCSGSFSVAVSTTSLCISSTTATSTNATQSLAGCIGNADDDVWFSFVASSNTHSISVTPGTMNNAVFQVFTGTCAGLTTYSCVNNTSGTSVESSIIEGLNIGTTYYVRVYSNGNNTNTGTFSVCITTPDNPCSSLTNIASCGTSISTTFAAGTGSYGTSACGFTTGGYEKIFTFTPATTGNYYIQQGSSFAYIDYQFKLVSAGCSSTGWTCVDDISGAGSSATAMALTAGVQYYILLDPESTAGGNVTFTINCPPTPPANDNCNGATPATVSSGTTCATLTNGTLLGATASTQTTSCVSGNTGTDVWYSFVATASSHSITINNIAGNETDLYHSVYAGACNSLGTAIVCSDPNNSTVNGLILGNTYYIRIYTYYSAPNANTTFSVCIKTGPPTGPCGNPANNDYCSNPATLTQGPGTFSSTTSSIYSADQSTPLSGIFCGSIENNSWYYFIATATSASFPFTSITGCTWNDGVQAQVYSVTTTTNNCCTGFTSVSNCYNPGTTSTGTVTATGLTVGQKYILMVDGWGGDVCNFTVSGWTATGILPLEMMTFDGHNEGEKNLIQWVTASEKNTNFFRLEKSKDGVNFEKLLDYDAAGNSESPKYYNAFDLDPFEGVTYYRLKLFNLDGSYDYSNIITVNNKNLTDYISDARPNPTNGVLEFDVNLKSKGKVNIEIYDNKGILISSESRNIENTYQSLNLDLNNFDSGIYLLKVTFEGSGKSEIQKIIKN